MTAPAVKAQYRCHEEQSNSKATPAKSSPMGLFVRLHLTGPVRRHRCCHRRCCQRQRSQRLRTPRRSCPASHGAFPALAAASASAPAAARARGAYGYQAPGAASPRATPQRCHVAEPGRWAWQGEVVRGLRIVETEDLRFLRRAIAAERWRIAAPMAIIQPDLLLPAC